MLTTLCPGSHRSEQNSQNPGRFRVTFRGKKTGTNDIIAKKLLKQAKS